jgi:hypothetical protein
MRLSVLLLALPAACSSTESQSASGAPPEDAAVESSMQGDAAAADAAPPATDAPEADVAPTADWVVRLDPSSPAGPLPVTLLGHYDLSGALFGYDQVPGLAASMHKVGFSEWRVGVERWEVGTLLFPALTDAAATSCAPSLLGLPAEAFAPKGWTDFDLLAQRDWFTHTDGAPVTLAMTGDDSRYALGYVRAVLDVAAKLGVEPFVDIDAVPRALSAGSTPSRVPGPIPDPCLCTFTNAISNVRPADPNVFAAAAVGLVRRVIEGSGGEPARHARYWEVWNEPEMPHFWDVSFEPGGGRDKFFEMAVLTLVRLDAYRAGSASAAAKALRFGLASFASAEICKGVIETFDANEITPGTHVPADFFSFHAYSNDPLAIAAEVERVAAARKASSHYGASELVLAEWGPDLSGQGWSASSMDVPLLSSTVIALGAAAGLDHAHHTLFWNYFDGLPFGLLERDMRATPAYHGYAMLASVIRPGARRLAAAGLESGKLEAGAGALLASADSGGKVRVLLVNRGTAVRSARFELSGSRAGASEVLTFDAPAQPPRATAASEVVTVPPRSLVVVTL